MSNNVPVVIIGAGCFGISTAVHLLRRGYKNVTILDKSAILPAPDAASTDINKVAFIQGSYLTEAHDHDRSVVRTILIRSMLGWQRMQLLNSESPNSKVSSMRQDCYALLPRDIRTKSWLSS